MAERVRLSDELVAKLTDDTEPRLVIELASELQEARAVMRESLTWFEDDLEPANATEAMMWKACAARIRTLLPSEEPA
jgi:hypothetical protein